MSADADLECPICHGYYNCPKILACHHVVCRDCVVSWLNTGQEGGCPLCRAPILPPSSLGQSQVDALVDNLPTDLVTESLVRGHEVIEAADVCAVCPNSMAATHYCCECEEKLCHTCSRHHTRTRGTKDHDLLDLNTLTAQDLADRFQLPCQNHSSRQAEVYCPAHQELICWECSTRRHHGCAEVKIIADEAADKRKELNSLVQKWRTKETDLLKKIQTRKNKYKHQRCEVNAAFGEMERNMKKRWHEILDDIQKAEDDDVDLDKVRASVAASAATLERLLKSKADSVVVRMMEQLRPRSLGVDSRCGEADRIKDVKSVQLDDQKVAEVKHLLATIEKKPAVKMTASVTVAASATSTTVQTTSVNTATPGTTRHQYSAPSAAYRPSQQYSLTPSTTASNQQPLPPQSSPLPIRAAPMRMRSPPPRPRMRSPPPPRMRSPPRRMRSPPQPRMLTRSPTRRRSPPPQRSLTASNQQCVPPPSRSQPSPPSRLYPTLPNPSPYQVYSPPTDATALSSQPNVPPPIPHPASTTSTLLSPSFSESLARAKTVAARVSAARNRANMAKAKAAASASAVSTGATAVSPMAAAPLSGTAAVSAVAAGPLWFDVAAHDWTATFTTSTTPTNPTPTPTTTTPTKPSKATLRKVRRWLALARTLKVGDRVRLSNNSSRRIYGRELGLGTVTAIPTWIQGMIKVRWDSGEEWQCSMGGYNGYDLELL